jgi:hypothetical protein
MERKYYSSHSCSSLFFYFLYFATHLPLHLPLGPAATVLCMSSVPLPLTYLSYIKEREWHTNVHKLLLSKYICMRHLASYSHYICLREAAFSLYSSSHDTAAAECPTLLHTPITFVFSFQPNLIFPPHRIECGIGFYTYPHHHLPLNPSSLVFIFFFSSQSVR